MQIMSLRAELLQASGWCTCYTSSLVLTYRGKLYHDYLLLGCYHGIVLRMPGVMMLSSCWVCSYCDFAMKAHGCLQFGGFSRSSRVRAITRLTETNSLNNQM